MSPRRPEQRADEGLTARDIALVVGRGLTEWDVRRRAVREGWPFRRAPRRGRMEPHYIVGCLPRDVELALRQAVEADGAGRERGRGA